MCGSRSRLDCVGLLGHYAMVNGKITDLSLSQWTPTMEARTGPAYRFQLQGAPRVPGGRPSISLDGNSYYDFPNRNMAGEFSACMWWKRAKADDFARAFVMSNLQSADGVEMRSSRNTDLQDQDDARFNSRRSGSPAQQLTNSKGL